MKRPSIADVYLKNMNNASYFYKLRKGYTLLRAALPYLP